MTMQSKCQWCESSTTKLVEVMNEEGLHTVCEKCKQTNENDTCVKCGNRLYGELALEGKCSGCYQEIAAEREKRKSEIMNGLGLEALQVLTHSVVFTEEDYQKWVTFGQGNFTPEIRRRNRMNWIRQKLVQENGWGQEVFDNNKQDIEHLFNNYAHRIFNSSCRFVIKGENDKGLHGIEIVAQKGNVMVISSGI